MDQEASTEKKLDVLVALHGQCKEEGRHYQQMCASVTSYSIFIVLGILGVMKLGHTPWVVSMFLCLLIVILGAMGLWLTSKNCARVDCQRHQAQLFRLEIATLMKNGGSESEVFPKVQNHEAKSASEGETAQSIWKGFHRGIIVVGLALAVLCSGLHWCDAEKKGRKFITWCSEGQPE